MGGGGRGREEGGRGQRETSNITCQSAYLELRKLRLIRHVLTVGATKTLVTSLVLSHLDYYNSLSSGIPQQLIDKLQKVQNRSARLIFKTSKSTHVSPLLAKLHCLPITKFPPCATKLSQILLRCTCLISFAFTSLPVHCVPLLTPASFGFQHERKSPKGSVLSPISALSLGTNCPTLYVMLKHNPSSKLS